MKARLDWKTILAGILAMILMIPIGLVYIDTVRSMFLSEREEALVSATMQAAAEVEARLEGDMDSLKAIATLRNIGDPAVSMESKLEILQMEAERRGFLRLNLTDTSGIGRTSDGEAIDISDREHFLLALEGQPNVSRRLSAKLGDEAIVVEAVPVTFEGEVVGVLAATQSVDHMSEMVTALTFRRGEHAVLLSDEGEFITSDRDGLLLEFPSLQDVAGAQDDEVTASRIVRMVAEQSGAAAFDYDDKVWVASVAPIANTHFMLLVFAEAEAVMASANRFISLSFVVLAALTVLFTAAVSYTFRMRGRYIEAQRAHFEEISDIAYKDQLTGLPNRAAMVREMLARFAMFRREGSLGVVLMIDIDEFKTINNVFGHAVGDDILTQVAQRLRAFEGERRGDVIVGRFGGDEFLLVGTVDELRDVRVLAAQVSALFEGEEFRSQVDEPVSVSIGAVVYNEDRNRAAIDIEEVLRHAELSLASAKRSDEDVHFVVFDAELGRQADDEIRMAYDLRNAIDAGELALQYQPQFDIERGRIVGMEALLRWNSPTYGSVPPSVFIPMAESSGLIVDIGKFVLDRAFAFAKSIEGTGVQVSCNCSPVEILHREFVESLFERFVAHKLHRGSVAIEVTETSLIGSFEQVTSKLRELQSRGIEIHLDDFGTGFSSLTYLKSLPLNAVKIDKSFTAEVSTNRVDMEIVRTIVDLCDHLGVSVIAEGVETAQQLGALVDCGCTVVQGYYVSRPVDEETAHRLLCSADAFILRDDLPEGIVRAGE